MLLGPEIANTPAPLEVIVILLPPDTVIGPDDSEPAAPILLTRAPVEEIVIVLRLDANPIPAPATRDSDPVDAFSVNAAPPPVGPEIVTEFSDTPTEIAPAPLNWRLLLKEPEEESVVFPNALILTVEKLVTVGVVAEIVRLPAPPPTEIIPAPEMLRRFEKVPLDERVVLPSAVRETLLVWMLAEKVIVLAFWPIPIPAPADRETEFDVPFSVKAEVATVGPEIVILPADWERVILLPP